MRAPIIAGLLISFAIIGSCIALGRLATSQDCTPLLGAAKLATDQAETDRGSPEGYIADEIARDAWSRYAACRHQR